MSFSNFEELSILKAYGDILKQMYDDFFGHRSLLVWCRAGSVLQRIC